MPKKGIPDLQHWLWIRLHAGLFGQVDSGSDFMMHQKQSSLDNFFILYVAHFLGKVCTMCILVMPSESQVILERIQIRKTFECRIRFHD